MDEAQTDVVVQPPIEEDAEVLRAEIERLKQENEVLAAAAEPDARRTRLLRNGFAKAILIIGALLLGLAVPAVWLNRTIMDTDQWVATVGPLASDPAIQTVVGDAAANAVLERVDFKPYLEQLLPEQLQPLASPISASLESFIRTQTQELVKSEQFADIWVEVNRKSHPLIIGALTKSEGTVSNQGGAIVLDVGALADTVLASLSERGISLADRIPAGSLDKEVVLYESPMLAQATAGIDAMNKAAIWLPWAALFLIAGAIALAADRRAIVLWLGVAIIIVGLLPLEAIYLGQSAVTSAALALGQSQSDAAQAAYQIIFADLVRATRVLLSVGFVLWAGALVAGPARWAVALRGGFSHGLSGVSRSWNLGAFGDWVAAHKPGLRGGGLVATALVFLAIPIRSIGLLFGLIAALIVWLALVEVLGGGSEPAEENPEEAQSA